jgi:hypothetical protein
VIMPAKCVSSISPRFHYRRVAFCFLPLAAILESPTYIFNFLRNLHTNFHRGYTNLNSHQQLLRIPFSLHSHQHLSSFVFLKIIVLTVVRWNLNVIFICMPFMVRDVEHFFMYFLVICASFKNCLFNSFAHLFSCCFS